MTTQTIDERESCLKGKIPALMNIRELEVKAYETTLFQGLNGTQTAIFEALNAADKDEFVLAMGVRSTKDEKYNILWEKWHNDRVRKKILCKVIFSDK